MPPFAATWKQSCQLLEEGSHQVPCGMYRSGKGMALLGLFKDVDRFLIGVASMHKEGAWGGDRSTS